MYYAEKQILNKNKDIASIVCHHLAKKRPV